MGQVVLKNPILWFGVAISGLELLNLPFLTLKEFKSIHTILLFNIYSPLRSLFPIDTTSQVYTYSVNLWGGRHICHSAASFMQIQCCKPITILFHGKCSDDLHCLIPAIQTFIARAHHTTSKVPNHPYFSSIPHIRRKFHTSSFFSRTNASRKLSIFLFT